MKNATASADLAAYLKLRPTGPLTVWKSGAVHNGYGKIGVKFASYDAAHAAILSHGFTVAHVSDGFTDYEKAGPVAAENGAGEWACIMEVEDSLQNADVFFNGFTGRRNCHSDSYGTCVDFATLAQWQAKAEFPAERIAECVRYWLGNENMQPPLRLVALTLERKLQTVTA
jgi:hypothetical protein